MYVLVLPSSSSDVIGIALGLTAAACWEAYILLNRTAGARLPGVQAPAVASTLGAIAFLPVLVVLAAQNRLWGPELAWAASAGLLASVVPLAADLTALRYVPARFFGVFMSAHPALAALAGLVILGQSLALHEGQASLSSCSPTPSPSDSTTARAAQRNSPRLCSRRRPTSGPRAAAGSQRAPR